MSTEEAATVDLYHCTDRELEALIEGARDVLRQREADRRRRGEMARQLRVTGEYLNEGEYVSCGKCQRCREGEKPHGPYAYLYKKSENTPSGYTSKYVPKKKVGEEKERLESKRLRAESEIERMESQAGEEGG